MLKNFSEKFLTAYLNRIDKVRILKTVPLSVFVITVVVVAIIAGAAGYYLKPAPPPPPPKPGEGMVVYWIGGAAGDPFDARLYKGATDAANQLGIKLVYVHTEWDPDKMVAEFKKAIAANPDGIVVMGHPGLEALKPLFKEAADKGILVTLANVDIPELREKYWFTGYVGQNLYMSGYTLAKAALEKFKDRLKPGAKVAIFSGSWEQPARALRAIRVEDAFKEAGLAVDRVSHPPAVYGSPAEGLPFVSGYLAKNPDVVLICFDGGGTTAAAADYLKSLGKKPGEIIVIGFDLTPGSVAGLKEGYVQLVIDQQPYLQGYLTVLNLFLSKKYKFAGLYIDTGGAVIDSESVKWVEDLVEKGYR